MPAPETLLKIAVKQYSTSYEFRKQRIEDIRKNEAYYIGRKVKAPIGRFAVSLPTMSGFVDHMMSKIDDAPSLNFGYRDIADKRLAEKVTSAWAVDSHPNKANWPLKDRWAKKTALFSGRAIYKIYSESDPEYKHNLDVVEFEDFMFEPMGGGNLENHLFCGHDNLFRTKTTLMRGAKAGIYDANQVSKLFAKLSDDTEKKAEDIYKSKAERLSKLGLSLTNNEYVGQSMVKLVEWYMDYEGERYKLLFEWFTQTWISCQKLKDVFESNLWPFTTWATNEDPFNFASKAPCDDMRPVAEAIDIIFNQALDNRYKRNFGQRAYDSSIFPNPEELEWRPDGLVRATAIKKGVNINQGIYTFETPEITGSIDLINFMDIYTGKKLGSLQQEGGAQDAADQKVGIYFGQLQQMADLIGLKNKSYRESHLGLGLRYAWGLKEHLKEPMLVKMIGENGVEWEELTRGEAQKSPDLDLDITGGSAEVMANEAKARRKAEGVALIMKSQTLMSQVNPQWLLGEILAPAWDPAEARLAMSKDPGNLDQISRASEAIQQILKGKKPKLMRTANTAFMQYILDFAMDHEDLEQNEFDALMAYIDAHKRYAVENTMRQAQNIKIQQKENMARSMLNVSENVAIPERNAGSPLSPGISGNRATNIIQGKTNPAEIAV